MNNKYTDSEKSIITARYGDGESVADLVRDTQIPRNTIYAWIKEEVAGESNRKTVSLKNYRILENKVTRLQGIIEILNSRNLFLREKGFPPRLMTAAIRRGGMCERRVRNNHMSCVTSRPPTKTTLIFSLDSTITLSRICLTI